MITSAKPIPRRLATVCLGGYPYYTLKIDDLKTKAGDTITPRLLIFLVWKRNV